MVQATWKGAVIAQSDATVVVDGNHYFPFDSVDGQYLEDSTTTTVCGWKGTANYYSLVVDGEKNADAAWVYREPKPEAQQIAGHVAFWKGVEVG